MWEEIEGMSEGYCERFSDVVSWDINCNRNPRPAPRQQNTDQRLLAERKIGGGERRCRRSAEREKGMVGGY